MMIVGLTGGIGSGKTTVGKMFKELGVPVYNSDVEAKRLMHASKEVKKAIIGLLGSEAYKGEELNKKYISDTVFKDAELLQKLNDIVHPAVKNHFKGWVKKQISPYVIQETALIFENSSQEFYDKIVLVTAPQNIRIQRVTKRDGVSKKNVMERIKNQLKDTEKIKLSDFVIKNTKLEKTKLIVRQVHSELLNLSS
ncbi:MAG: dephospho-CoA kinase [Bacteroidota bacterium]